jgi:nitrate/nitrite transporter NarK
MDLARDPAPPGVQRLPAGPARPAVSRAAPWIVFGACAPLFVCSQFYRVLNAVIAESLQAELGLGSEALGALSAAFFYAFALAQLPLAALLDRIGARVAMSVLSLVAAGGAFVFSTADSRAMAMAGEVLLGAGMSANLMGSMKLIGHWFRRKDFATVAGTFAALGTVGNVLATSPLALLASSLGWRRAVLAVGVATAALALAFAALVRERPPGEEAGAAEEGGPAEPIAVMLRRLVTSRDYWLISFGAFCRYGAFVSIQALWAGPFLVEVAGLSPLRAANLILLLNLAFVVGAPAGGWLSDRVLSSRKIPVLLALAGTGGAILALGLLGGAARGVASFAAVLALLGVLSSFGQVAWPHIRDLMPRGMSGMAMSGVNFFNILGAAAFLHGTGWILERTAGPGGARGAGQYRTAFLAVAAVVGLALALYSFTRDARAGVDPRRARRDGA